MLAIRRDGRGQMRRPFSPNAHASSHVVFMLHSLLFDHCHELVSCVSQWHFLPSKLQLVVERLIIVLAGMISPFSSPLLPLSPVEPLPSCLCHLERISCKAIGVDWPEPAVDQDAPSASVIVFQGNGCFLAIAEALSRQLSAKGILVKGEPLSGDISKNGL
jgi:hypothetical protein